MYQVNKNKKMDNGYFSLRKKSEARLLDFGVPGPASTEHKTKLTDNRRKS